MENRAHALAAGLFTLLLGVAAALGLLWLGQSKEHVDYYLLETRGNVTGLNLQAQVRYRGIRAGKVEAIGLDERDPQLIVVRISLDADYRLTRGSTAQLNSQGITGLSYVQLEDEGRQPEPLTAADGQLPRIKLQPSLMETLGDKAVDLADKAGQVASRLALLLDEKNLKNLSRSADNLAAASEGLRELPQVMASLREVLSARNLQRLAGILAQLEKTSGEAAPLTAELRETVKTMNGLAGRLDRLAAETGGELAATTLPRANALLQEVASNSRQISRLLESLEHNPQSLVFGAAPARPGPGEPGFEK